MFKLDLSATSNFDKANLINNHFVSCFSKPSSLPNPPALASHPTSLDIITVSSLKIIKVQRSTVASGPDEITSKMMKECAEANL